MATTVLDLETERAARPRARAVPGGHPLAFVLLLIDHGARRRHESAARRQRRQFRRSRPRLVLV
ncbi:MAG: hypothetical protein KatS3mg119_1184 [Rhodothalassiaceae bacterium]|nr:MAG: hypothetical protein KatS3mg119_1184 [Rhodothalassiaceae bacterium]